MTRSFLGVVALLGLGTITRSADAPTGSVGAAQGGSDTVQVAPPTGISETDRASILAALQQVQPGGVIQFAPGTYLLGDLIRVAVPRVTLQGHANGTTLRGCNPEQLRERQRERMANCNNGLELAAGHQTIRSITFEYTWHGLIVGCCFFGEDRSLELRTGGHVIEDNTFRNSVNGIRVLGEWPEPTMIRNNQFINTFHAVGAYGRTVHVLNNRISVPEPDRIPVRGFPSFAIGMGTTPAARLTCAHTVIASNRIEGHTDGIILFGGLGITCREHTIRNNTIQIRRVRFTPPSEVVRIRSESDSSIVGVPLALLNLQGDSSQAGALENNVIEGNHIIGAEGVAIQLFHASRNRVVNNRIIAVVARDPFPGNTHGGPSEWAEANGAGIWVSRRSDENEILGNTFEDIAAAAVVLEGDRNRVEPQSANDSVRDLGSGNRVSRRDSPIDAGAAARSLPRAEPNDQRRAAGRMIDGELHVQLDAVEAEWYPRGPDGPRIVTPVFAEPGAAPQVPGPLIRVAAGTPVRVTIRNTLNLPIDVRGFVDRHAMPPRPQRMPRDVPTFAFADSVVVPVGDTRVVRFTPSTEVSTFYFARVVLPDPSPFAPGRFVPGGFGGEGVFLGALVVDPPSGSGAGERLFVITRWGGREEPGTLAVTFKMMINGLSWPFTERLEYTAGDSVRWRVINTSAIAHPMHLHGFYFTVLGRGSTDADARFAAAAQPRAVTDLMPPFSSLQLEWVPERVGNWIFHCHLLRHMGTLQRFGTEGAAPAAADHAMHDMGGLVLGITVQPRRGTVVGEAAPARRLHLWTGQRPNVHGEHPELAFVVQDGAVPPTDSTRVPGSVLLLEQNQPTEIVVHNRLDFPFSIHWHGLEVESVYDGVGDWSGSPGATRPPIAPGDSVIVRITPPRAGTFIYHIHGESGHQLTQGLHGPLLVVAAGTMWDRERDRVFVLSARGASRDPPPVINGSAAPAPERFAPGRNYRLRFIHISPDASKRVRLLRDGEPVVWTLIAKDGADLQTPLRTPRPAAVELGVGETYDFEWSPDRNGLYVLEVVTTHYSASGLPPVLQRVAFGVGNVAAAELERVALVEPPAPSPADTATAITLSRAELARLTGTYEAQGVPVELTFALDANGLALTLTGGEPIALVPIGRFLFRPAVQGRTPPTRFEFELQGDRAVAVVWHCCPDNRARFARRRDQDE